MWSIQLLIRLRLGSEACRDRSYACRDVRMLVVTVRMLVMTVRMDEKEVIQSRMISRFKWDVTLKIFLRVIRGA